MSFLKRLLEFYLSVRAFFKNDIREITKVANADSYYSETERKPEKQRKKELLKWRLKYGEVNRFYNLYGFDVHDVNDEYIDYLSFMNSRNKKNNLRTIKSTVSLLRDKFLFYKLMSGFNQPVPEVFGVVRDGKVLDGNLEPIKSADLKNETDYFAKELDGECAPYVRHIKDFDDFCEKANEFDGRSLILQRRVFQCEEMQKINPCAINTIRIVTVKTKDGIKILSAVLRVGTKKSEGVDNWAAGGISVGIKEDGSLEEYGFYKPGYGGRVSVHPDTGVVFKDFVVPQYDKVKECVINAHKYFYGIHSIGWDIAVTDEGPVFIEGNDDWEISLMQVCNHGLRKEWEDVCR